MAGSGTAATTAAGGKSIAVGGATALLIASRFGFDPKASNGPGAMRGFFLAFTVLPFVLYGFAATVALRFSVDRAGADHEAQAREAGR